MLFFIRKTKLNILLIILNIYESVFRCTPPTELLLGMAQVYVRRRMEKKRKRECRIGNNWKQPYCLSSVELLNVFQYWHKDMEHMECDQKHTHKFTTKGRASTIASYKGNLTPSMSLVFL